MPSVRSPAWWWVLKTVAFFVTGSLLAGAALAQSRVSYEFQAGRDFQGPLQNVVIDRAGHAWISTPRQLYKVEHGSPHLVDFGASSDTRLALAPAGELYAWLNGGSAPFGLFTVELRNLNRPTQKIAELRLADAPYGFDTFYVGGRGELLVTATPLQSAEGLRGEFLYVFWSSRGKELARVRLEGPRMGIADEAGDAILLLGESDAVAFSKAGARLWKLNGRFRKGALADGGTLALLNPARAVNEVHIVRHGTVKIVSMPAPVHELALTPDGISGAVATDQGGLSFLSPRSCDANSCKVTAIPALPVPRIHYISSVRFIDRKTVALGVFQATGTAANVKYETGAILAVTTSGRVRFQQSIRLPQPAAWSPLINLNYGSPDFAAFTRNTAIFVRVSR